MENIKSEDTKVYSNVISKYSLYQRKLLGAPALPNPNTKAMFSEQPNK